MDLQWWQWLTGIAEFAAAAWLTDWTLGGRQLRADTINRQLANEDTRSDLEHPRCQCGAKTALFQTKCHSCFADQSAQRHEEFLRTPQPPPNRTVIHDRRRQPVPGEPVYLGDQVNLKLRRVMSQPNLFPEYGDDDVITIQQWGGGTVNIHRREQR